MTSAFPGAHELVRAIDDAVLLGDPHAITASLRASLARLIAEQRVQLPAAVFQADPDRYARRLLHLSEQHGYSVIAMTWAPGQGTPIHDHAGLWCVEGVWRGALEVTPYDLLEEVDGEARFRPQKTIHAGCGSTGSLIPPFEYHTILNPSDEATAVSLHIYRGAMTSCSVFRPDGSGWYARDQRQLSLDRTH